MGWFITSFVVVVLGILSGVLSRHGRMPRGGDWFGTRHGSRGREPFSVWIQWPLGGIALAIAILKYPLAAADNPEGFWGAVIAVSESVYATFQVFTGNSDLGDSWPVGAQRTGCELAGDVWATLLFTSAPLLVIIIGLSFFKSLCARWRYRLTRLPWKRDRHVHIFSELNDRSLALAQSIQQHDPKAVLVFTEVDHAADAPVAKLADKASRLGAICLKNNIVDPLLLPGSLIGKKTGTPAASDAILGQATRHFYAISESDEHNLVRAVDLMAQTTNQRYDLFVFSDSSASAQALQESPSQVSLHRINPKRTMIYNWLWREAMAISDGSNQISTGVGMLKAARPAADGVHEVRAAIIGLGDYGSEMLRALSWYCQVDGSTGPYYLIADAYDRDPGVTERFKAAYPELVDRAVTNRPAPGQPRQDSGYEIKLHGGAEGADPNVLAQVVASEPTFVFISLGDDARNLDLALELRRLFAREAQTPQILIAWRESDETRTRIEDRLVTESATRAVAPIHLIGSQAEVYSHDAIIRSSLENQGLICHLRWDICGNGDIVGAVKRFWTDEYCYSASLAVPIHWRVRIALGTPMERDALNRMEHARWSAFVRSEGFIHGTLKDIAMAKTHPLLINFDELDEKEQAKDKNDPLTSLQACDEYLAAMDTAQPEDREKNKALKIFLDSIRPGVVGPGQVINRAPSQHRQVLRCLRSIGYHYQRLPSRCR